MNIVVEGASDTEAAKSVIVHAGHEVARIFDKRGKSNLDPLIPNYIKAAEWEPWVVFRDTDSKCPVELRDTLLRGVEPPPSFALRLADSMTESWLLADASAFASFFGISEAKITRSPDDLKHAKQEVLRLCNDSSSRAIRNGMVADGTQVGPLFVSTINEFARDHWRVEVAQGASDSLNRAVHRVRTLGSTNLA